MIQVDLTRIPKWLWLILAIALPTGAAFAFMAYVANGMVAGDIIGLRGREHDISIAQHRSGVGLIFCVVLQMGTVGALFGFMDEQGGSNLSRVLGAILGSFALTIGCGSVLYFVFSIFH